MSDQHVWWDIWEEQHGEFDWRCQAINYIARFKTKEAAEKWRDAVLKVRKERGLKA